MATQLHTVNLSRSRQFANRRVPHKRGHCGLTPLTVSKSTKITRRVIFCTFPFLCTDFDL